MVGSLAGGFWVALVGCLGGGASRWRYLGCLGGLSWWRCALVVASGLPWWFVLVAWRLGGGICFALMCSLGERASWWWHLGCLGGLSWWQGVLVAASGLPWWAVLVAWRLGGGFLAALMGCLGGRAPWWRHLGCPGGLSWWHGANVVAYGLPW